MTPPVKSTRTDKIRLLVVDDHAVMRMGLVTAASDQPDMDVVAAVETGEEAIEAYRIHRPDVVILDLRMTGLGGLKTISALRTEFVGAKIVMFSNYAKGEEIYQAMKNGASSFVVKDMKLDKLLDAIRRVAEGQKYIPPELVSRMGERVSLQISDRESDVLKLLAQGRSNKEIGSLLGITEGTVKIHVTHLMGKLGVTARTEAVVVAARRGLIDLE